jgi:hypothetical protein
MFGYLRGKLCGVNERTEGKALDGDPTPENTIRGSVVAVRCFLVAKECT